MTLVAESERESIPLARYGDGLWVLARASGYPWPGEFDGACTPILPRLEGLVADGCDQILKATKNEHPVDASAVVHNSISK